MSKIIDVSVVVSVFNEQKYVVEAVTSIATQVGLCHEVVIVDDNSTDNTYEILCSLLEKYTNIRIYKNNNKGKCSAFNYGVSMAKGRFICIFAGDDVMPQGSLKQRFDVIEHESDEMCVVGLSKLVTMSEVKKFDGHLIPRAKGHGNLSGVSPLMNRRAAGIIFPTPENLPNEDTWMELMMLHMPGWKIIHSDIVCCKYRIHSGNSINLTVPFDEYNKKITLRMSAISLFYNEYKYKLNDDEKIKLENKIKLESARRGGDWVGVLTSNLSIVERLRALSSTNMLMYELRRKFYSLFSGW